MPPSKGRSGVDPSELHGRGDHWQRFKTGDFGQKWNSSKSIVREGRGAIAPLLNILSDPTIDAETHWFTIRALGNFPEPDVIAALAAQISDAPCHTHRPPEQAAELSAFAIETLAAMGTLAIEALSELLQHPQRRLLAAKALNQVRSSGVIPAMIEVADDEDALVRYYAIDALGSFHSPEVTPVLLRALQDVSTTVRKSAVMALGRRRDLQASYQLSQQLQPLLWDIDLAVSCQAALALGRLGASDTIEALQRVLLSEHTPMALRIDTIRALAWYCDRSETEPLKQTIQKAFAVLTHALTQFSVSHPDSSHPDSSHPDSSHAGNTDTEPVQISSIREKPQLLVAIIRVLGGLHHEPLAGRATQSLIKYLQSKPPAAVAQAIIMALASLGQPQAFDALLPLLNHPADTVPIHTVAALKRLDPDNSFKRATTYLSHFPDHQTDVLEFW